MRAHVADGHVIIRADVISTAVFGTLDDSRDARKLAAFYKLIDLFLEIKAASEYNGS